YTVGVDVMAKPRFPEGRAAMFVAGPDGPEKQLVMSLVADVGFEALDAGPLKTARLFEPLAML
ncbi:MAG: NADPH-dependent F420 reductase, partial [Methyloceanibacter sp.]